MNEYIDVLKNILGDKIYSELSNSIYAKVSKKFSRINKQNVTEMVEFNLANILVIGVETARGCNKSELLKTLSWYNLGPRSFLLVKNYDDFVKTYNKYIELIIKNVKDNQK